MIASPVRRVKLREVAARAGTSVTAASRALSGVGSVSRRTRDRVQRVAEDLGYRPSVLASALSAGVNAPRRCVIVGLGLPLAVLGASFYGPVIAGFASAAGHEGIDIHLVAADGDPGERDSALRRLAAEQRGDAYVILSFLSLTREDLAPLDEAGLPYVLVNRHLEHRAGAVVNAVTPNWFGATCDAVRRLAALGHCRLVLLVPNSDDSTVTDHVLGWHHGLDAAGLPAGSGTVKRYEQGELTKTIARILKGVRGEPESSPTAVVCFNDTVAFHVLACAAAADISVPGELSVIGFDNRIAAYTSPPLSTYDPNLIRVGEEAARLIGALLEDPARPPERLVVPATFVTRQTCAEAAGRLCVPR